MVSGGVSINRAGSGSRPCAILAYAALQGVYYFKIPGWDGVSVILIMLPGGGHIERPAHSAGLLNVTTLMVMLREGIIRS
jgi:hypothetical protein